jgi:hypothetical protein
LRFKTARANSSIKPYHKNRVGGMAQGEGPEFKPQYYLKKKKKKELPGRHKDMS